MTNKEQQIARMKELGELLRNASKAYYAEDREIMSNLEYDKLYDELEALEKETGTVLSGSPTMTVGYEAVDELPKERHASPMLSLDKTKDVGELAAFAGDHEVLLSWKLDGLTVVLTYENGQLTKAVTRGNGEVGEVITNNARVFKNQWLFFFCCRSVELGSVHKRHYFFSSEESKLPKLVTPHRIKPTISSYLNQSSILAFDGLDKACIVIRSDDGQS